VFITLVDEERNLWCLIHYWIHNGKIIFKILLVPHACRSV